MQGLVPLHEETLREKNYALLSPSGKPTSSGMALLKSLKNGALSPKEIASKTGHPLFRVRSGLRELENAGFVEEAEGKYALSKKGKTLVQ